MSDKATISSKDQKLLWGRSLNRCAFTDCAQFLTEGNGSSGLVIGEMAHIVGEKPGAARWNPNVLPKVLNSYANLILMCPTHHTQIDKNERTYTVEALLRMKEKRERQISTRVNVYLTSDQVYSVLTALVTSADTEPKSLYVSVGTADFVCPWIKRIATEWHQRILITELVIVRMRDEVIRALEERGLLEPGFLKALEGNIKAMATDDAVVEKGIKVVERFWENRPPFHGYLYGSRVLVGKWETDSTGRLHVRTLVYDTSDPEEVARVRKAFARSRSAS